MKFVGREDAMTTLHQQLQQSERVAISAVSGMGGIGKTELALQYAHHYKKERYPGGVCWLRARDENVGVQLVTYAKVQMELNPPDDFEPEKKLEQQVAYCWRNWDQELGDVLVILDDVVNYEEVADYLPPVDPRFKVLITTRQQWLGESFQRLELQVLDEPAALELLVSLVGESRIEAEAETAKALCEDLGRLPLGLELVGRYLKRKPDLSLETMRQRLGLEHRSLEKTKTSSEMTAKRGVKAAFELSWQELDADARILAGLLSLFAPAPISWSLVESCLSAKPKIVRTGCFSFPVFSSIVKRLQNLFKTRRNDEAENQETLSVSKIEDIRDEVLVNFSLLQRNEDGTYQLHPLIREFLRGKLEQDRICKVGKILPTLPEDLKLEEILKRSICQVMVAEAKEIPKTPTRENILEIAPAIPHIAEVAEKLTNWLTDDDLITPFTALDRFYAGQGFYSQAQPWCNQCLSVSQTRLGENHPLVATFLNNLANLYQSQGRYEEAEPLYLQALEMYKRILGENHPLVATSLNNLASLYKSQGRYEEAEPLLVQALEMRKRILGENDADVATSLNNRAELYNSQGRYEEAEPLYLQALEMYKRILGENHPNVATSLNNLAMLYNSQGRYQEAEPLLVQALEMKKRIFGENHPDVAQSLNNLAMLYKSQGRYEEAEPFYLQALEMYKRILGENHPDVATSLNNLAFLYYSQGRYEDAEPLYLQALETRKRILRENHPDVATSLNNLALLYYSQGRYEDAEPLYMQAWKMYKRIFGENHSRVALSLNNLALLYYSQGRYEEAEPFYLQALEMTKRIFGENHPDVASSLNNLAMLYYSQGRYEDAEPLYLQALEMFKRIFGENHPNVAQSLNNLAELYKSQGRYKEAEPLYLQAWKIRKRILGVNNPDVAQSLNNLAELYKSQGRYKEAEPLYLEALSIVPRLGENHPLTQAVLQNYSRFLQQVVRENRQEELSAEMSLEIMADMQE